MHKLSASDEKHECLKGGKKAHPLGVEKQSGIRNYTQVSIRSRLVKDNEVTGL